jgi:thiamine monophosphate synthase
LAAVGSLSRVLDGGAKTIQVRAKQLSSGALLELCEELVGVATSFGGGIVVNDRADVAKMSARPVSTSARMTSHPERRDRSSDQMRSSDVPRIPSNR